MTAAAAAALKANLMGVVGGKIGFQERSLARLPCLKSSQVKSSQVKSSHRRVVRFSDAPSMARAIWAGTCPTAPHSTHKHTRAVRSQLEPSCAEGATRERSIYHFIVSQTHV